MHEHIFTVRNMSISFDEEGHILPEEEEEVPEEEEPQKEKWDLIRRVFGDAWAEKARVATARAQKLSEEERKAVKAYAVQNMPPETQFIEWVQPDTERVLHVYLIETGNKVDPRQTKTGSVLVTAFHMGEPFVLFFTGYDDPDLQLVTDNSVYLAVVRPGSSRIKGGNVLALIPLSQ